MADAMHASGLLVIDVPEAVDQLDSTAFAAQKGGALVRWFRVHAPPII